ncbi:MAG: helix-turn-helix domain-containing protein [Gemmatimonadaceae bacterium]
MSPIRLRVAELRQAKGWTQKQLAERAGISRQTVIRVESESNRRLDYDVLEKLAGAFAVDPAFLIVHEARPRRRAGA